jgi:hypothetical protein
MVETYTIIPPAIPSAGVYHFTTESGQEYEVRFGRRQDNILMATIVFGVINDEYEGEEYVVTNKGEVYKVMATIVEVVKMFMEQHPKVLSYEFTGYAKPGEEEKQETVRINMYKRYLPMIFDKTWKIDYKGNTIVVLKNR